jgi:hypothetical protein
MKSNEKTFALPVEPNKVVYFFSERWRMALTTKHGVLLLIHHFLTNNNKQSLCSI